VYHNDVTFKNKSLKSKTDQMYGILITLHRY